MNNPKGLPFAAVSVVSLYYISLMSPRWPYLSFGTAVKVAVPAALALSIRAGALLYAGYSGTLAAVLVMRTVAWPWAQQNPFIRPFVGLLGFSNFDYDGMVLVGVLLSIAPQLAGVR